MNRILLHNGNKNIKPRLATLWGATPVPCITDHWIIDNQTFFTVQEKISFFNNCTNIVSDLTTADRIELTDLVKFKKNLKFVKVVSGYNEDLSNIEEVWNKENYTQTQWIESLFCRLSISDQLIWWNNISLPHCEDLEPMVFTPGRCGTHLILDITQLPLTNYLHHDNEIIHKEKFQKIINSKKIYAVLRKSLLKQTLSDLVAKTVGHYMLTTKDNVEQHKKIVSRWNKIQFSEEDCLVSLTRIMNYVDILLGLRYFYDKNIVFGLLEDLSHHYDQTTTYIKNPWEYNDLIENYTQAVEICETYQLFYNSIINNATKILGTSLFNNE